MKNPLLTDGSLGGRKRARMAGFTLIELATTLVIILVLVGLLSSALNHTTSKVLRISCMENVKQLQTAWLIYMDDNDQMFPLNQSVGGGNNPKIPIEKLSTNSWVAGNPRLDLSQAGIASGTLFEYTMRNARVYRCPMDGSTVMNRSDLPRSRSYSISTYLGGDKAGIDPQVKVKYDQLVSPRPANVLVFMEEHEESFFRASFVIPTDRATLASVFETSTPSDRHYQGCHLSFADGHVEFWKWYNTRSGTGTARLSAAKATELDNKRLQSCIPSP